MKTLAAVFLFALPAFGQVTDVPQPKWFDTQTKIELSASALAIAADGWTTRLNAANTASAGYRFDEYNPLLRPAINSDVETSLYFGAAFSTQILANWLLQKRPRERHVLNWAVVGMEIYWASYNTYKRRF